MDGAGTGTVGRGAAGALRALAPCLLALWAAGCAGQGPVPAPSPGHLQPPPAVQAAPIPEPVTRAPLLPAPEPAGAQPRYSVSVQEVPVRELLFALARDAGVEADLHAGLEGRVTLNAVERTLPELLERLARQADLRWELRGRTLVVEPDSPYPRHYAVDYLNMARETVKSVSVATQISTTGGEAGSGPGPANTSTTSVTSLSPQRFWHGLVSALAALLGEAGPGEAGAATPLITPSVIAHPESGVLTVRASRREHLQVQALLDRVLESARREVLVEATVVEVELTDRYRAGIDWARLARGAGLTLQQGLLAGALGQAPFFLLEYADEQTAEGSVELTVRALSEFGDAQVLSSPRLMVLNNQTALLKVVDNQVYFTIEVETTSTQGVVDRSFQTTVHTVPVGFVMSVTPGIDAEGGVVLNVRPTVSRIAGFVEDPNPALAEAGVVNRIPVIQTREMDSLLRVQSGQTAVLGGLMQDEGSVGTEGVPVLEDIPRLGALFQAREERRVKTELVVFLRPVVVSSPDLLSDLREYRGYLERAAAPGGLGSPWP